MEKDFSPEEKLLRLIRGGKRLKPHEASSVPASSNGPRQKLRSKFRRFQIQDVQRLLWGILFISFVYLLVSFTWSMLLRQKDDNVYIVKEEAEIIEEEVKPTVKPYDFYQKAITGRHIFRSSPAQTTRVTQTQQPYASAKERIKDFNLLGIISGDNPQAIIEDKKMQKTYFLKSGEFFGEIKVEEISEGKVTLELQEQRFDLFL